MSEDLVAYYRLRAAEYDNVYAKPERQDDIAALGERLSELLAGCRILELAAGTGFWTQFMAERARRILATDINEQMLTIAQGRSYPPDVVSFEVADAFEPESITGTYDAVAAAFFLSHIERARGAQFVESLVNRVNSAGLVVLLDNNYVEGSNHPITRVDGSANTYQERRLEDGTRFEVLKNFYSEAQLVELSAGTGHVVQFTHYWLMWLETPITRGNR
ncbi:MAG: class I SAM-dependent methyltransferase [Acidimicrobiales bacterium]